MYVLEGKVNEERFVLLRCTLDEIDCGITDERCTVCVIDRTVWQACTRVRRRARLEPIVPRVARGAGEILVVIRAASLAASGNMGVARAASLEVSHVLIKAPARRCVIFLVHAE